MSSFLVIYGSGTGQTAKVARFIGTILEERDHSVTTTNVTDASDLEVGDFDAILIGSPVVDRSHLPEIVSFVSEHSEALRDRPTAFFQLSFASILPSEWAQSGAMEWVDELVAGTDWLPDRIGLFPGAIKYTEYNRPTRTLFKLISAVTTGDTDTTRDYEYTDWDEVEAFATDFARFVEAGGVELEDAIEVGGGGHEAGADETGSRVVTVGTPTADGSVVEDVGTETGRRITRTLAGIGAAVSAVGIVYWLLARRRSRVE